MSTRGDRTNSYLAKISFGKAIHEATASLMETTDGLDATLRKICKAIVSIPIYNGTFISEFREDTQSFHILAHGGFSKKLLKQLEELIRVSPIGIELKLSHKDNIAIRATKEHRILTSDDLSSLTKPLMGKKVSRAVAKLLHISSYATVPLFADEELVGGMLVTSKKPEFTKEELESLETFSYAAALALQKAKSAQILQETNKFLRNILESSRSVSIVSTDWEGNIHYWNEGAENILGYKAEEVVGHQKIGILYPEDEKETIKTVMEARSFILKNKKGTSCDVVERTKDGQKVWIHLNLSPRFDENGNVIGILGIGQDITERKQTEEVLQQSEEKYRNIFESLTDVYYRTDNEMRITVISPSVRAYGYEPEEMIGTRSSDYYYDQAERDEFAEQLKKYGEVHDFEVRLLAKDGTPILMSANVQVVFDRDGNPDGLEGMLRDLTKRKQADEALRESEKRYRTLINSAPIGIGVHQDGKWVMVNKATLDLLGYDKKEELIGKPAIEILHPDYREFAAKRIQEIAKTGKPAPLVEEKVLKKDGSIIHALISSTPITYKEKLAFHAAAVDITALKEAQQEIEKRQKYLEAVLNDAPDAIVTIDASHGIIEWNPGAELVFGYTREDVLGKNLDDLITKEDVSGEAVTLTKQVLSGKEVLPRETVRYRKDGTPINVVVAGSPIQIEGKLHGVVAVYTDITERKQAEEEIGRLLEVEKKRYRQIGGVIDVANQIRLGTPLGSILKQVADVISTNLGWQTVIMTRCDPDFSNSKLVTGVGIPQEDLDKLMKSAKETAVTRPGFKDYFLQDRFLLNKSYFIPEEFGGLDRLGEPNVYVDKPKRYMTGEWKTGDFMFVPIRDRKGKVLGIITVDRPADGHRPDIDDAKILELFADQAAIAIENATLFDKMAESESKYRILSEQLTEANNIKELLLDVITHDLKNPAGVISEVTKMMAEENPEEESIQLVKDSSDSLLKVVGNVIALARITLEEEIEKEELDLAEMIEQIIREFLPSLKNTGMTIENLLHEPLLVKANKIIGEVFRNYISNAIKYAPEGRKIIIKGQREDDFIIVAVKDLGKSIPKKDYLYIFERSIQLERGEKRGRGLGLAIVKRIVGAHDGKAWVEANKPKGNIFYMKIPAS